LQQKERFDRSPSPDLFSTAIASAEDIERHLKQTFWLKKTVRPFVELKRFIEFLAPDSA
jgi:hypothetical protein